MDVLSKAMLSRSQEPKVQAAIDYVFRKRRLIASGLEAPHPRIPVYGMIQLSDEDIEEYAKLAATEKPTTAEVDPL